MILSSKASKILIFFLLGLCFYSCNKDTEFAELSFVGDSLVARWDLQNSFPSSYVRNYGVSGSGLEYLESLAGKFNGKKVVVISGTNNIANLKDKDDNAITAYAQQYISAIESLGADRIYLYSIFPRGKKFDGDSLNPIIVKLNDNIKNLTKTERSVIQYLDVYELLSYKGLLNPNYSLDGLHLNIYGYEIISAKLQF